MMLKLGSLHVIVFGSFGIGVNRIALLHARPHFLVAHQHHIKNTHVFVGKLILTQVSHALMFVFGDVSCRRLKRAAQDLHEGRFTSAIGADQAIAIAFAKLDIDVLEQGFNPELHGDICGDKHGNSDLMNSTKTKGWILPAFTSRAAKEARI